LHEIDHLDGVLFIDHIQQLDLSPLQKLKRNLSL
jgi:peptide deformylase